MDLVQMTVRGISYSETQTGAYALILNEKKGERKESVQINNNTDELLNWKASVNLKEWIKINKNVRSK